MKCPSLHLWVPRGYPPGEDNHEPRAADTPATLSPPPSIAARPTIWAPTVALWLCSNSTGAAPSPRSPSGSVSVAARSTIGSRPIDIIPSQVPWSPITAQAGPRNGTRTPKPSCGRSLDQPPDHFGYQATAWTIPLLQISSGSLGFDRILRCHAAPPVACLGLRLETAALRPGPGPAPGREDATDPPVYQGVGAARRRPVRGRDRPAAVPALASLLGAAREDAEVPLSGGNAKRVLFGALNPSNGTRLFLERKKQRKEDFQEFLGLIHQQYRGWQVSLVLDGDSSHTAKASRRDARSFGNPTGLAAGPMSRTEPDGSPVAPWQGANLCQSAVRVDRGTSASLPPLSGGIVRGRDAAESGRIIRGLLVEIGIKDGHFMGLSANRREIGEKRPENQA